MKKIILTALLAGSVALAQGRKNQVAVDANNRVGLRLMQEVTKEELRKSETKNIMISPLSAHEALSMALNGTRSRTESEFKKFFGYANNVNLSEVNNANQEIRSSLVKVPMTKEEKMKLNPGQKPTFGFTVANSAWNTNGKTTGRPYNFSTGFISTLKSNYAIASTRSMDFVDPKAADVVNKWCEDNTNGMVKKIVSKDDLEKFLWILLNATYLEGAWEHGFREIKGNVEPNFTLATNQKVVVKSMSQQSHTNYYEDGHVQSVELPIYKSTVSVYVIAPKTIGDYQQLQKDGGVWSREYLAQVIAKAQPKHGLIAMPKFSFDYGVELKEDAPLTQSLGLNFLFKDGADFSKMDAPGTIPSKVGIIKQNTRVEFDENGIKAAAVTMIGGIERTSVPHFEFKMNVDKPFFFVIFDKQTASLLFLGQVADPRTK
ncbi:MAG: hypothetical protein A4S09_11870 [Proteobacteria bacterium SG_bin7]|nr:MAG: hypothetical protein A4S09_11870 [Proteobacteria bacterium SG_bin7]